MRAEQLLPLRPRLVQRTELWQLDDHDAPVQRPSRRVVLPVDLVVRNRLGLAKAFGADPGGRDSLRAEILLDRFRPAHAELHVVLLGALGVRVALDFHAGVAVLLQVPYRDSERVLGALCERRLVELEEHTLQRKQFACHGRRRSRWWRWRRSRY